MPLYDYKCSDCGTTFEKMVRFSEADLKPVCPNCDSKETHKEISACASFGNSSSLSSGSTGSSCGSGGGFT